MEPVLAGWRDTEKSPITQMHLGAPGTLPRPLAAFLRERLPEAMQAAHHEVLRDKKLERSWIAFQEHVYHETLNHLLAIRKDLVALQQGQDRLIAGQDEIKDILVGQVQTRTDWNIPPPTTHFQDGPS